MRLQLLMTALEEAVQALSAQLDEQRSATARGFADQRLQTDGIADDVRILREKLDNTNVRISSMSLEIEALRMAIPPMPPFPTTELLIDPETGLRVAPPTDAVPTRPPGPTAAGVSPQRMFDTAWADDTSSQWDLAIEGFEAYLQMFPRSELADDAQFYVGDTHYSAGQFEDAIRAFENVPLEHPNGDIVPDAHYKRGLALERLGETDRAREAFELLLDNYPDSTMATLAQQRLSQLER
jgi:tol-pal system protein YbgF